MTPNAVILLYLIFGSFFHLFCLVKIKIIFRENSLIYLDFSAGKSHALHKRVEQLCTRAIRWAELKRKSKVLHFFP